MHDIHRGYFRNRNCTKEAQLLLEIVNFEILGWGVREDRVGVRYWKL